MKYQSITIERNPRLGKAFKTEEQVKKTMSGHKKKSIITPTFLTSYFIELFSNNKLKLHTETDTIEVTQTLRKNGFNMELVDLDLKKLTININKNP